MPVSGAQPRGSQLSTAEQDLLRIACCIKCRSDLEFDEGGESLLRCTGCPASYPVVHGVPVLLDPDADEVSSLVRDFYASGWKRKDGGALAAREIHEDLSDYGQQYIKTNEDRFISFLEDERVEFFLDVGCGAQPRVDFGIHGDRHVCLDLSLEGLIEARQILGDRAICICGSILDIPLKDGVADQVIASHTLYHIDRDLQPVAISEIARVRAPHGKALIFYVNPDSPERRFYSSIVAAGRWVKRMIRGSSLPVREPALYYSPHSISFMMDCLAEKFPGAKVSVQPLRVLIKKTSQPLMRHHLLGKWVLRLLFAVEARMRSRPRTASYVSYLIE
ncbi:MAG: hypothetical protein CME06_01120 [Gemmatimonadetes bacterium]|nr:hypothetical protein [Gemmatimonadota bacterium]